jgi:hypothetical protein
MTKAHMAYGLWPGELKMGVTSKYAKLWNLGPLSRSKIANFLNELVKSSILNKKCHQI